MRYHSFVGKLPVIGEKECRRDAKRRSSSPAFNILLIANFVHAYATRFVHSYQSWECQ